MIEKRFKKMDTIIDPFPIWDTVEEKGYNCTDTLDVLVDLLNVMNDTLLKQADENHKLSNKLNEQQNKIDNLIKEKILMEYQLKVQDRIIDDYERQG